jgi:hypothetical protein
MNITKQNIHRWEHPGFLAWARPGTKVENVTVDRCDVQNQSGLVMIETPGVRKLTIDDSFNRVKPGKSNHPKTYVVMGWPPGSQTVQTAIEWCRWNATGEHYYQGPYEALFRGKFDDFKLSGGTFHGYIQENGTPAKQILQIRHGKKWVFEGVTFVDGWNDHGQQKVAGEGYVKSQHVESVLYDGCNFGRWAPAKKLWSRQPGCDKIILAGDCRDPDGKRLKNGERWS